MSYNLVVSSATHHDIDEGVAYYEKERQGLGFEFLSIVEDFLYRVANRPYNFSFIDEHKHIRFVKINRFPYIIVYLIEENYVYVIALHNTNRDRERLIKSLY